MKVLIDGKPVSIHNDIRVIWDDINSHFTAYDSVTLEEKKDKGYLQLVLNSEGCIIDYFDKKEDNESTATAWMDVEDLVQHCH